MWELWKVVPWFSQIIQDICRQLVEHGRASHTGKPLPEDPRGESIHSFVDKEVSIVPKNEEILKINLFEFCILWK